LILVLLRVACKNAASPLPDAPHPSYKMPVIYYDVLAFSLLTIVLSTTIVELDYCVTINKALHITSYMPERKK
jgi:hypothetical protein